MGAAAIGLKLVGQHGIALGQLEKILQLGLKQVFSMFGCNIETILRQEFC